MSFSRSCRRQVAHDRLLVPGEDDLRLVEERARALERAGACRAGGRRGAAGGRSGRAGGTGARAQSAISNTVKATIADRHGLLAHEALRSSRGRRAEVDRARRRRERPDENARQDERHGEEPDRPVEEADTAANGAGGGEAFRSRRLLRPATLRGPPSSLISGGGWPTASAHRQSAAAPMLRSE